MDDSEVGQFAMGQWDFLSETEQPWMLRSPVAVLFLGTEQNPPSSEDCIVVVIVARFGTMVGKVFIAQTQVRRTQQESNVLAWADDATAFLNIVTKRCSSGGAISQSKIEPHSF